MKISVISAVVALMLAPALWAQATQPATQPARTAEQVIADLQAAQEAADLPDIQDLVDAEKRKEVAAKVLPHMKKVPALLDELAAVEPRFAPNVGESKTGLYTIMSLLGDAEATAALKAAAEAKGGTSAKAAQQLVKWWLNAKDAEVQGKVLDEMLVLAKAEPMEDALAKTLMTMSKVGAATKEVAERAEKILTDELKGEIAQQIAESSAGERKLRGIEGKPLTLAGVTMDGGKFTTADWKGKVVLVDFWATWCGPCMAELPRVKKVYADFHDKGLEIIGVSCDRDADALKKLIADNSKEMPWPQLFDAANPGWHALATAYGVEGIPTMFLIDRNGVVRSIDARENFETLIPKLLEEKAGETPATQPAK